MAVKIPDEAWFDFETTFDHESVQRWTAANRSLSVVMGLIYVGAVYLGQSIMKNRQPFELRKLLSAWNLLMFLFSLTIFVRMARFTVLNLLEKSLYTQVCDGHYSEISFVFWLDLFVLSKPIEFIDTLFIVARKQHLHFLHWYHHASVVVLCWYTLGDPKSVSPNSLYYVGMNSFVHSAMYLYYFCRSLKMRVPRPLQMTLTTLQISQMIFGCFINSSALYYRLEGAYCASTYESIFLALGIYASYFALFANFFYNTYLAIPKKQGSDKKSD